MFTFTSMNYELQNHIEDEGNYQEWLHNHESEDDEMPDEVEPAELSAFEEHQQDMENEFRLNHTN